MGVIYENYLTSNQGSAYHPSKLVAAIKSYVFDRLRLSHILKRLRPDSRVLDIGAGAGRLLEMIQKNTKHNCKLYANELSFDARTKQHLNEKGIVPVEGPIEDWQTNLKFDAIVGIHVIEHVLDPVQIFRWISEHLNENGVLYFETPDAGAFCARLFGAKWGMTHFPRHINIFSKADLLKISKQVGLKVKLQVNTTSAPAWNMSIRNCAGLDALKKHKSIFEIFNYSNLFTLSFFTVVDLILLLCGVATSTQQLVAVKENVET